MKTEPETKAVAASYGISVPQVVVAHSPLEAGAVAAKLLETSKKVVVKLRQRRSRISRMREVLFSILRQRKPPKRLRG